MSSILRIIEDKKYLLLCFLWLLFLVWRTSVFLNTKSSPEAGIIQGIAFASHHSYQRGIKARLTRIDLPPATAAQSDKEQRELTFPLSYSGAFKAYNIPPGKYNISFTKHGYQPTSRNIIVQANSLTKIPPIILKRSLGSNYFYHFVHALNILAFSFLLITGIGTYHLRHGDFVAKAFLRCCLIVSFWSLWGIVSYVLEPLGCGAQANAFGFAV